MKGNVGRVNLKYSVSKGVLTIALSGDCTGASLLDAATLRRVADAGVAAVILDGRDITNWDSALVVFVRRVQRLAASRNMTVRIVKMPAGCMNMLGMTDAPACALPPRRAPESRLAVVGDWGIRTYDAFRRAMVFVGRVGASVMRMFRGRANTRKIDWWFAFEDVGPRAILIVSLISFLIGLILAFVGAAQLKLFGAQVYVASLVAIASIRIMGAMMTGVIMAGRTGAAYAATIGTMQTNEELDALSTMGVSRMDFLVLPRVVALTVSMPILTLLADVMAILGGMLVGVAMFGIPAPEYIAYTLDALDFQNFSVGILHGAVYGIIIALCGCYYGINSGRNANSVGVSTTRAVVASVVWMIVATGIITFIFEVLGI